VLKINENTPTGIIADSHSKNSLTIEAIHILKGMGAEEIIHLGDFCDSLLPEKMDDAVKIMNNYNIQAIMGNNEYIVIKEYLPYHQDYFKEETISFLSELPFTIIKSDICFTHSTPYNHPAATRRPLMEYIAILILEKTHQFRITFRGHSHSPSLIKINGESITEWGIESQTKVSLSKDGIYVITVGAIENRYCAFFNPIDNQLTSISF